MDLNIFIKIIGSNTLHVFPITTLRGPLTWKLYSPRARNRFNQVVEAKRFEGVFLFRKVC